MNISRHRSHPVKVAENWFKLSQAPLITWIITWVIDLIKCRYSINADDLYNPDLKDQLQSLAGKIESKGLYKLYDLLLMRQRLLDTSINKQSLFEEILITWADLNLRK